MDIQNLIDNISTNCSRIQKRTFVKGSIITTYMEKRRQICILTSGKADLIRYNLNGSQDIIDKFSKNDIFGETFYPVNSNNELVVKATDNCEVLIFLYDDISIKCKQNCKYHTELSANLLEIVIQNTMHQNTRIEVLSKRTIRDKLLTYFSILSNKNYNKKITIPFSLTSLADYLSVDRSAMMREIKSLIDEGFIIKESKNVIRLMY
ncbi:MAG: Crp/Fnr family transcriptional regulator [Clostridia bacterium]|nr:Crp/Fnr family transcriptional regulator [Clostridia bacterium]